MGTITVYRKSKTGAIEKMTVNDSPASLKALTSRRGRRVTKSELGVRTSHERPPYANPWRPDEERERKEREAEAEKAKKSKKG